jgi:uncharacterized protein (DUF2235 family)
MSKNIIICADGTGNKGGAGDDTNVYKLYKGLDLTDNSNQIAYYHDGVGTNENKYLKALSGALGFGFKSNINNLYRFLAKNYIPGDNIYLFGFSRGAATVRALAGMIQTVGLLDRNNSEIMTDGFLDDLKLDLQVMKAMRAYSRYKTHPQDAESYMQKKTHGVVPIEMIGVWDTVSALGFPQDTSMLVVLASKILDKVSDWVIPHHFYNYQLDKNVKNVYHALAIDDDRATFHPKVWNETRQDRPKNIEQVWFAGAHSNVGGGYPRSGLSSVALSWMLNHAMDRGVLFNSDIKHDTRNDANANGKIYDPRAGMMVYYKFAPRHINNLCTKDGVSILQGDIKIHSSVFERIKYSDYAPILPNTYEIINNSEWQTKKKRIIVKTNDVSKKLKTRINRLLKARTFLYHIFVESSVILAGSIYYLAQNGSSGISSSSTYNFIVSNLPNFMSNFLYYMVYTNSVLGASIIGFFLVLFLSYKLLRIFTYRTAKSIIFHSKI